MFAGSAFLHTGPVHLIGNIMALTWLGTRISDRWGEGWFVWIYLAAMLGGAIGFGALSQNPAPMVGASGAIFGFVAAWIVGALAGSAQRGSDGLDFDQAGARPDAGSGWI